MDLKCRLFYVSKEDILGDLCYESGQWKEGSLQKQKIGVGKRSCIAAHRGSNGYRPIDIVFYQS